ncbi:MAG TPA: IS110 family transposase, partial [Flavobacterium sp.]
HKEKPALDLYNRTIEKHGIKMKSYVAVQKKLLVLIYHIWKKNEQYDSCYRGKKKQISRRYPNDFNKKK